MKKNTIALSVLSIMLLAGCNETEYRDNPIPVDANTRGFWTLSSTEDCELSDYCYVDYSEYNSKLYPIDSGDRMLTALEAKNAEVSVSGRLENAIKLVPFMDDQGQMEGQPRLQTDQYSDFESRPIGDEFTIQIRATGEEGSILSLWNDDGLGLHVEIIDDVFMATFEQHQRKLFTNIKAADFHELMLRSDGTTVTLTSACEQVAEFTRTPGQPILSSAPLKLTAYEMRGGYTDASQYIGAIDMIRISDRFESNVFC
ncbi:hypothetical protein [Vibrio maritimus]|uniref:hypothetical protein n=1 Tax=Vibrio maritimus TaxID=990268 RepID=UPI003735A23E